MPSFWHDWEKALAGWPDDALSAMCAGLGVLFLWLAIKGGAMAKATAILYAVLP